MATKRERSRSPPRHGRNQFAGKDRFKVLLKNLPYDVNGQKLKDICKDVGGEGVMFADIIQNQNGKSAGFGSVEFKTRQEMEEIAKKN
jgi:RNA recognition motif-containing protein